MPRAQDATTDDKTFLVLSVLKGDLTTADAARLADVTADQVRKWKEQFIAGGRAAFDEAERRDLQLGLFNHAVYNLVLALQHLGMRVVPEPNGGWYVRESSAV